MFWLALIASIVGVSAVPAPQAPSSPATRPNPQACGRVSSSFAAGNTLVPASSAYECLRTVPNRAQPAQQLVQSLKTFAQWQSTLPWLKDPPQSYGFPPIDILGKLDQISQSAAGGKFESEYEFQFEIHATFGAAHDGHFFYLGDVFKAFTFTNELANDIVSLSSNGTTLPSLYHLADLQPNSGVEPLAITEINGRNATQFLVDLNMILGNSQDIDAQWNALFPIYANPTGFNPLSFSSFYLGPSLTLTYEDGSTTTRPSQARLNQNISLSNIITGDDYYDTFCTPSKVAPSVTASVATPARPTSTLARRSPLLTDYPDSKIVTDDMGTIMGFFLDNDFNDTAVLAISSFDEVNSQGLVRFQNITKTFLSRCRDAGKQKLVIDLVSNGGGSVQAGFELFAQLFPGVDPFNARDIHLTDALGNMSHLLNSLPPQQQQTALSLSLVAGDLLPLNLLKPGGEKFSTAAEIISPVTLQGDQFTAYMRQKPDIGFNVTGTGNQTNPSTAVFKPENVVLLTDGTCASTCTIFSYLMIFQRDVKTVSVGGLPQARAMQSVGGVEGGQDLVFAQISQEAQNALTLVQDKTEAQKLQAGDLGILAEGYAIQRSIDPIKTTGGVNYKNAFAPSDSKTPLQFLYEPANCRFFYTPNMIHNPELVWQYASSATWTDPDGLCVQGSRVPVNTSKAVDPAFLANSASATGSGGSTPTSAGSGSASTETNAANDQGKKHNSAPGRLLGHAGAQAGWLLATTLAAILYI
ncbi:hypothetical protein GGR54DRAFT_1998 [Hypoxylon sp. NC1633]|nr:hypothetical protein GGR54DRAFT_1998 [Hypoxylon sp. NC1633]